MRRFDRSLISILVLLASVNAGCLAQPTPQVEIPRIEQMPNLPQPYEMRDWNKVARDYDALVFDFDRQGRFLPVIRWHEAPGDSGRQVFALDTYVGWASNGYETINCLGAVSGATTAGIDKSDQNGRDWVTLCTGYFTDRYGLNLYLNNPNDKTGSSFWYELFPSVLFYRIYNHYPDTEGMKQQFRLTADRWYEACIAMGGKIRTGTVPNFDHTAFDFIHMTPVDNGNWKEADSAAAIAWLEYMAHVKTGETKYLTAAQWGLQFLEERRENPYYEVLLPLGAYLAARMNAEKGTDYNVEKLVNWCFDASNPRRWGASAGQWGDVDGSGLIGSVVSEAGDYAFAMNTFEPASSLVPLVRYDERFARAIGKWMLNAANSARLFYANGLADDQQTDADWAKRYDPNSCIAYEGLRRVFTEIDRVTGDFETEYGHVRSGTFTDAIYTDKHCEVLEEAASNEGYRLVHIWEATLTDAAHHTLNVVARCGSDEAFQISYASVRTGPIQGPSPSLPRKTRAKACYSISKAPCSFSRSRMWDTRQWTTQQTHSTWTTSGSNRPVTNRPSPAATPRAADGPRRTLACTDRRSWASSAASSRRPTYPESSGWIAWRRTISTPQPARPSSTTIRIPSPGR